MTDLRSFWTVNHLARVLDMSPSAVRRALIRGDLPGLVRVGRTLRVDPEDFRRWVKAQKTLARSPGVVVND